MSSPAGASIPAQTKGVTKPASAGTKCPRCGSASIVELEKADPDANPVYRCRPCGHLFSTRR